MLTWLGQWWLKQISHFILGKCIVDCYLIEYPQSLLHPLHMVYVHNPYHKFGKLCPRWRKCIFIRYNEHSKGYVFIGEHEYETILELESWDVTFLKDNFPCMVEIDRDLHFHEMMDPNIRSTLEQKLMFKPSGSKLVLIASIVRDPILRKKFQHIIHRWWFEIEGEIHIVSQYDDVEPKSVHEALICPIKDEWRKIMEE